MSIFLLPLIVRDPIRRIAQYGVGFVGYKAEGFSTDAEASTALNRAVVDRSTIEGPAVKGQP